MSNVMAEYTSECPRRADVGKRTHCVRHVMYDDVVEVGDMER